MKIPRLPHSWLLTPAQAIAVQRRMAALVSIEPPTAPFRLVGGLDAAFSKDGRQCLAAVVVWDMTAREVVEEQTAARRLAFPYIPGLLSFREVPALLAALRRLRCRPDVLMCDGQGLAHPRRFGIACHVGVLTNLPAIGCAKSRLIGTHTEPARERGSSAALNDGAEVVGAVLRIQDGVRPLYVSAGHRIDLGHAVDVVLRCATRYRIPEPTRLADKLVAAVKRGSAIVRRE